MGDKIFNNKSGWVKITNIILFITTTLYALESIFIRGLFTNIPLGILNIILSTIALVISFINKAYKLVIIDLIILALTTTIVLYFMYM